MVRQREGCLRSGKDIYRTDSSTWDLCVMCSGKKGWDHGKYQDTRDRSPTLYVWCVVGRREGIPGSTGYFGSVRGGSQEVAADIKVYTQWGRGRFKLERVQRKKGILAWLVG